MSPSWLRKLLKKKFVGSGAGPTAPIKNRRLFVEVLEDRTVPATIFWDGGADSNGQGGVLDRDRNNNGNSTDVGETGSLLWSNPLNWTGDQVPGPNDDVVFDHSRFPARQSTNYNAYFARQANRDAGLRGIVPNSIMDLTTTIKSLTIRGPGPTGGWFISRGGLPLDPIANPNYDPINNPAVLYPAFPATLTVLGNVDFDGPGTATIDFDMRFVSTLQNMNVTDPTGIFNVNGSIGIAAGVTTPVGITKLGRGTLRFGDLGDSSLRVIPNTSPRIGIPYYPSNPNNDNTFDGLVTVDVGVLVVGKNGALGTTGSGTVVRDGATLSLVNNVTIPESIQIQGSGVQSGGAGIGALGGYGTVDGGVALAPSATIGGAITVIGGNLRTNISEYIIINGVISGAGDLTLIGGTILTNANTYGGITFLRPNLYGTVSSTTITNGDALSPGMFTVIDANATLFLSGSILVDDEVLFINGIGNVDAYTLNQFGALSSGTGVNEWRSRIYVENNASIGAYEFSALIISGQISSMPRPGTPAIPLTPLERDALARYSTLNRPVTARASLTKYGKDVVFLPNANRDFLGDFIITDGTVVMENPFALGAATGTGGSIFVNSDIPTLQFGTLEVKGRYTVSKNLTLNGNGYTRPGNTDPSGALFISDNFGDPDPTAIVWAGTVTLTTPTGNNTSTTITTDAGQSLTISGVVGGLAGRNLQKNGAGSLTLTANNTFLGAVTVRAGLLEFTTATGLGGAGGAGTFVASGATLKFGGGLTIVNEALTLSSELGVAATLLVGPGVNLWTGIVNIVGNRTVSGVDEIIINTTAGAGSIEFSNVISGDSKLRKLGPGTMRFSGSASNTFRPTLLGDSALVIDGGTVVLAKTLGPNGVPVNAVAGPITIGDGLGGDSVDVLRLEQPNQIPDTQLITINSSGLFDLNGFNEVTAAPVMAGGEIRTGAGTLTVIGTITTLASTETSKISGKLSFGTAPAQFSVANDGADTLVPDLQVDAVISNGLNTGLVKFGAGSLQLGGANAYTGSTTVVEGVLRLGANNVLPDGTTVILAGGATLDANGKTDTVAAVTGAGTLALGTGGITVGANNSSSTFSGTITGAAGGRLVKVGTGTLTLNGPASLGNAATTNIVGGTVFVNTDIRNAPVTVQNGATLGGTGVVGAVTAAAGGRVSPGMSPGALVSPTGDLTLNAGSVFIAEINGNTAGTGYDRFTTTGTVNINGAKLSLTLGGGFAPALTDDTFDILVGATRVGTFAGLADGAQFVLNNRVLQINYLADRVRISTVANAAALAVVSSNNPALPNTPITFTFTITPTLGTDTRPTGTVQFYDNGVAIGAPVTLTGGATGAGTAVLVVDGTLIPFLASGPHTITAEYIGDASYLAGTARVQQQVTSPSTTIVAPQQGPTVFGDNAGFLVTVPRLAGLPVPTGTVTFVNAATGQVLGVVALNGAGQAVFATTALPAGTATIRAVYSGDTFYRTSSGTATQVVDRQNRIVVGSDAGPVATVQVFDSRSGALLQTLQPFDQYTLGVKVATGDVNGDGIADIIVSAGAGAPGGHVRVFDGATFAEIASFFTFVGYTGGVNIAAGDVDGDGFADVIVGTAIANDHVKAFSGRGLVSGISPDASTLMSFFAYGGGNPVGVTVGAGDVDGDGRADVITGSATFAGHVKVFQGGTAQIIGSYFAYGEGYLGGIYVAGGDLNGDGRSEIITGATNAPHVKALTQAGTELASFFAYTNADGSPAPFGVRVGAADRNGDRLADIITGAGGSAPAVKVFSGLDPSLLLESFLAVPVGQAPSTSGVFVGGSTK